MFLIWYQSTRVAVDFISANQSTESIIPQHLSYVSNTQHIHHVNSSRQSTHRAFLTCPSSTHHTPCSSFYIHQPPKLSRRFFLMCSHSTCCIPDVLLLIVSPHSAVCTVKPDPSTFVFCSPQATSSRDIPTVCAPDALVFKHLCLTARMPTTHVWQELSVIDYTFDQINFPYSTGGRHEHGAFVITWETLRNC